MISIIKFMIVKLTKALIDLTDFYIRKNAQTSVAVKSRIIDLQHTVAQCEDNIESHTSFIKSVKENVKGL